jgi:hypothetical protein
MPQGLFTFAGAADDAVLIAVMQHVKQLTAALPDWWRLDVITVGLDGHSLHYIRTMLRDLQHTASPIQALVLPRRVRMRGRRGDSSHDWLASTLPH